MKALEQKNTKVNGKSPFTLDYTVYSMFLE